MKTIIGICLLGVLCFSTNSCQKEFAISGIDSSLLTQPGSVTGSLTATIDGTHFVANKVAAASRALNVIAITGQDNSGQTLVLRVADSGVHVYTLDIASSTNAGAYTKDNGIAYTTNGGDDASQSGGTLSITSIDTVKKTMSGTFSILVYRPLDSLQKTITEGVFTNISYATQAIPPANSTDTFNVKVDGVQFATYSINGISAIGLINISASNQDVSRTVRLSISSAYTPGTYTFTLLDFNLIGQYDIDTSYLSANSGSLTILENNAVTKRIRGSFNFNASELLGTKTAALTEGYFSVAYQ